MPPAVGKRASDKKSSSVGAPVVNKNLEAGLVKAPFEEDSWQACVSMVVGRSLQEEEDLISFVALAVQKPQRRLFSLLSRNSVLTKIQALGNLKSKKPNELHMFYEVTEPAKVLLDAGGEIPSDLMAKILKILLLEIKTSDQHRRETEQLKIEGQKGKVTPPSDVKAKGTDKKGKGPSSAHEASRGKKTKLKCRDDVEEPTFIDDEPDSGPQHYILLVGFYQPELIWALDTIGVHVANIIKICSDHTRSYEREQEHDSCEDLSLRASPVLDAELSLKAKMFDQFWSDLRPVLDSGPPDSRLHDVVQLSYVVPDLTLPLQTQEPEAVLELGSRIFAGVANLIYDSLDWRRQYQHYCDHVKLISVPSVVGLDSQPVQVVPAVLQTPRSKKKSFREQDPLGQETKLSVDVDMRYYNNLLDLVPPESCSVPLILHCMLEQVVISTEQSFSSSSQMPEKPQPVSGPGLDHKLVSYMLQNFLPLLRTEEERNQLFNNLLTTVQKEEDKKRLMEKFGGANIEKTSEQPLVIRHHDERALRLRDVGMVHGFSPAEVELTMMRLSPVWDLIQSVSEQRNSAPCWLAVKQQLQHYCTDGMVSWSDVERLIHQSVFEAMTLSTVDQQGVLVNDCNQLEPAHQQTLRIIPWDSPLSYTKQKLHNLQTKGTFLTEDPGNTEFCGTVGVQLDLSEMQSCRLRSLFDWHYAEHHSADVFTQVLASASEEYRSLDTFRGSHKNILYIFCHNPVNSHGRSKEFWDVALHTDVKFRKYLEHVADSISDWTREEELKRDAMLIRTQSPADSLKEEDATCSAPEDKPLEPVIRKDSLKAWKMEQERLKEEEMTKRSNKENTPRAKQQREEVVTEKKSKTVSGGKKSRVDAVDSKVPTESNITSAATADKTKEPHLTDGPDKSFTGYSMNGQLIHVSGCVQHLYPSDGGRITVENISFVEGCNLMTVAVKKDGHHFFTHINQVVVVDSSKPPSQPQDKKQTNLKLERRECEPVVMKTVKQGSFSAVLDNKIHLSYSFYGPSGEYTVSSEEAKRENPKCSEGADLELVSSTRQIQSSQGREHQPSPFNGLSLSVPNGLLLQFLREDTEGVSPEERGILVKQSFPLRSKEQVRHLQDTSLSKELYRIISSQGAVICHMRDGSTEVLFADGSVSFSQDSGPVWVPDAEADENKKGQTSEKEAKAQKGCWQTTSPSGDRICTVGTTHKHLPTTSLLTFKATDPVTHQVMLSREDLVVLVQNPDGSLIVEHADGTRITSFHQDRPLKGEKPESVTLKSNICMCVPQCVDMQDGRHSGEEISRNGAESTCDKKDTCRKVSGSVENDKTCESEKGATSVKEQVVLVEKEGCASVVMYPERHTAHVFLADGTVVTGNSRAEYEVFPSNVGVLQIQSQGQCVYSSDPLVAPSPKVCIDQRGVYTMSHTDQVACEVTDEDGNLFQVKEDGQVSVLKSSPVPRILTHKEEEDKEKARPHKVHRPRLFLVHEDGSGTEMLSSHTVEELLNQAYSDPTIAVLKEPLPDRQDEFGITVLKPSHESVWSQWLLKKQKPDITPPNLRNRSWHDFPTAEKKSPGPPFGSDLGVGLTLRERPCGPAAQHQCVQTCPKVLEIRELYEHRPFTTPLKNTIDSRLKEYMESLMEREQRSEEMKVKDPRVEEESAHTRDLFHLILSFAEEDDTSHTGDPRTSVDVVSLYSRGVAASRESDVSEDTDMDADSLDGSQQFTSGKDLRWTERLAQHRQAISEEKTYREALQKKIIVPYFHPENLPLYQSLVPDLEQDVGTGLPLVPLKSASTETIMERVSQESSPRPLNPTPGQAERHAAQSDRMPKKGPINPKLQSAGESSRRSSSRQWKSVHVDVTGNPRRSKVGQPTYFLGSNPHSKPKKHFLTVEEPVRRKCRTVSLTDPSAVLRGFQLLPSSVDFGTVQEGTSVTFTVIMKNVGVDTCRFHVKQPPPATGLRVLYSPGPVAAGLHIKLQVQLFATLGETEPKRYISEDITLQTETDILHLSVTAVVLSGRLYDEEHRKRGSEARRKSLR